MASAKTQDDLPEHYMRKIKSIPYLTNEEEFHLAKKWRDQGDKESIDKLVSSHMRLVAKIAQGYRGYGLPMSDLVAEGHIGMMQAVKHFDPERGFRFSTYAMWWIKASIQEYILNSWSLVKIGTTGAQKKLFFKLRQIKQRLNTHTLTPEQVSEIAKNLSVRESDVMMMQERMQGNDHSLNAPLKADGEGESEWIDWLEDETENPELSLVHRDEHQKRRKLLNDSLNALSERERHIFHDRRIHEPPMTLDELSVKYDISRERVRQIEMRAFEKLQKAIKFHTFGKLY